MTIVEPKDVAEYLSLVKRGLQMDLIYDSQVSIMASLASNPCLADLVKEWKNGQENR